MRLMYVSLIAYTLALASCATSTPSEADARTAFENSIRSKVGATTFTITSFSKTNGQEAELAGVKHYRLFYSASVSLPDGFHPECVQGKSFVGFNCWFQFNGSSLRPQPRGAEVPFSGEVDFQKTENGWAVEGVS